MNDWEMNSQASGKQTNVLTQPANTAIILGAVSENRMNSTRMNSRTTTKQTNAQPKTKTAEKGEKVTTENVM